MKPANILILCSDEHARSASGAYGHPVTLTPALDQLALGGTRFTNAYTPSPICIPARASIATGLQVHQTRCWSSAEPYHGQIESWMHRIREAGHAAVSIGKLHFRSANDDNGFSEEILPMHAANDGKGWPQGLLRDPLPPFADAEELAAQTGRGDSDYTEYDRRITAEACSWLKRYPRRIKDRPWALFVSFVSPHYPLKAPPAFYDLYGGKDIPPPFGCAPGERPEHPVLEEMYRFWNYDEYFDDALRLEARRCYYGLTSFLDDNIRQVLMALEDSGAARDTVIVYMSDHGEMLGNFGFWTKSVMYEDSVAVPLIVSGPEIPAGVNETPVSLSDIAATVEQTVGLGARKAEEPWQSRPLQGFIEAPEPDRFILSEYHDGGSPVSFYMIRHKDLKYVHYAGANPAQMFDLAADPRELHDLAPSAHHEGGRERMRNLLSSILDPEEAAGRREANRLALLERYGGRDAVLALKSFNHTPVEV